MGFNKCLTKRMEMVGLPAPHQLFTTLPAAIAITKALADFVKTYGTEVTFGELMGAGFVGSGAAIASEIVGIAGAIVADITVSFYVGALIVASVWCGYAPNHPDVTSAAFMSRIDYYAKINKISLSEEMRDYLNYNSDSYAV